MKLPKQHVYALGRLKQGALNKTEQAYHDFLRIRALSGEILWFKFEALKFRLADNTFYTPDFIVMLPCGTIEAHEVKGSLAFIQDDAMVKIKVAAEMYPFRFMLIAPKARKVGGWEIKHVGNKI